ncbi:MAG TPA: PaaX family transcriptional regulator C-terminal domain-containing protein [Streptosporangiaceae bacterium]|jgi:phenylacetic acid degradation operon negative regulatory protein
MPGRNTPAAAAAPVPTLSRRHEAGAASARGLLFTLLGEFVLPTGGVAWTSAVLDVFGRLGVEEKTTRQALMRTAAAGWLHADKVGRRTRWLLSDSARQLLTDGAERIYSFTGSAQDWDGRWLLVSVRIPDGDRRARHVVRSRLTWAGFGSLGAGLWISPHTSREAEAAGVLRAAGVASDAHVFVAARSGVGDVRDMVAAAWDLTAVEEQYERFVAEFGRAQLSQERAGGALARQVELVHAWRRFPAIDPVLPRELLPRRWSGLKAASLFAGRHAEWSAAARLEWARLNDVD